MTAGYIHYVFHGVDPTGVIKPGIFRENEKFYANTDCLFLASHTSVYHCRKTVKARRMKFVAHERGTQKHLIP
jgi:hypothetical protein